MSTAATTTVQPTSPTIAIPCPRLEFRWLKLGPTWSHCECVYSLVFPLQLHDIRREDQDGNDVQSEKSLEIGRTTVTGGTDTPPIYADGRVHTPYRDGAHAQWDRQSLGSHLPIVAICGDVATLVEINPS